ncbi:hypothetical protein AM588_10002346 [Phytophthora nicotianae]|uniref:Uncharacterized protein n=1 Tax=Phytophthora nicotianae TaxID=4792 RepID=A0A0W8D0L6_PHYNI|nr:hypothetical protein AM588_10002346 [Phytophthora nicotianae]
MLTTAFPILWKDVHEPGIKGVVEMHMSELPLKGARVGDLFPVLNAKINAKLPFERSFRKVESFLMYGTRVRRDRTLEELIPELRSNPRFVVNMRLCPGREPRTSIAIFIKTLTNKSILLHCDTTDAVAYLKCRIRDKENTAVDLQSLVFEGKQLEDHLQLCSYGIENHSVVHLVRMMRGGGGPSRMFADVSDDSILVVQEFSPNAPAWRSVHRGLNIEGRCKNVECVAFQQMIIHPKRYEAFNLMRDGDIQCPMCHKKVKPRTCGFYGCFWKFDGTQERDGYSIISQWKDACGRKYHRFNADKMIGSVEWESLLIVAKPRDESTTVMLSSTAQPAGLSRTSKCTICWSEIGSTPSGFVITIGCGHSFHCACIDNWSGWCDRNGTLPSCPVCRREVKSPGHA